jgi:hypothetical protein
MHKHVDIQPASSLRDDINILLVARAGNASVTVRNLSTGDTRGASQDGEIPYTPLTAQVLREHDLQQLAFSPLARYRHAVEHRQIIGLNATHDNLRSDQTEGLETGNSSNFGSMVGSDDMLGPTVSNKLQKQSRQCDTTNTRDELDYERTADWSTDCQYPDSSYQDDRVSMLEREGYDIDCEQVESGLQLAARGNDLAGVGAHLEDYGCEDGLDDFVVE